MISVKIDTHGCKLNQADSIQLYKKFIQNGFNVNSNLENPDIYILNSCTVTHVADKKARKSGYKKVTDEDIAAVGFQSMDELASALTEGKATLSKLKPLKPWFALDPPRHGFKRSTKRLYGQKGVLGYNKELSVIVKRMM